MTLSRKAWSPGDRTIADFDDEIICRPAGGRVVLDCGFFEKASDPDFSSFPDEGPFPGAASPCAADIRRNAESEDPYDCLSGHDLRYRLMPHWNRKECLRDLGIDPNLAMREAREAFSDWPFEGRWTDQVQVARHAEFFYRLLTEIARRDIREGAVTPEAAKDVVVAEMEDEFPYGTPVPMNDAVRVKLRARLGEDLAPDIREDPSP